MNSLIRLLYALLIAGAVVAFVAMGINTVYQGPKYPYYPSYNASNTAAEDTQQQDQFDKKVKDYDKKQKAYYRNVSFIALPSALVITAVGLYLYKRSDIVGEGVALGGVGTGIYAVTTSSLADQRVIRFLSLIVLLGSAIIIAHRRFVRPPINHI